MRVPAPYLSAVVEFLLRNDFKHVSVVTDSMLTAKDGTRKVYLLVQVTSDKTAVVPNVFLRLAAFDRARADIVTIDDSGGVLELKHIMNVGKES